MLPYQVQQGVYFVISAVIVLAAWRLLQRFSASPVRRLWWCLGGFAALLLGFAVFVGFAPGGANLSGFMLIALGYYGFGIVLPLIGLLQFRRSKAAALLSLPILLLSLWAALGEPNRLQTREERIEVGRFAAGRPIRIAHISDLQTIGHCAREDDALRRVNDFEPDLILFSGDYIAGPFDEPGPAVDAARRFLGGLRARLGVVVVDGHSEPRLIREEIFAGLDVIYLKDEERIFELEDGRRIRVFGAMTHDARFDRIHAPADASELSIVVSHMPDQTRDLTGLEVDLHLAGHTHGGQIVIPGFGAPMTLSSMPRRFARGLHRFEDHWLNVNAGIGMEGNHAPRIRLFCPPEVCLIEVEGRSIGVER